MKNYYYSFCFIPLIITSQIAYAQTEATNNYAYGATIEYVDEQSMFNRVNLNEMVYSQTVSPTLDDVRVFNSKGQPVPFALTTTKNEYYNRQQTKLAVFPLESKTTNSSKNNNYQVIIDGNNINLNIKQNNQNNHIQSYLLDIPNKADISYNDLNFKLNFAEQNNWQVTATLSYSHDLKSWQTAVRNVSLMNLVNNNNQALTINDIPVSTYQYKRSPYWLLTLQSSSPFPALQDAELIAQGASSEYQTNPVAVNDIAYDDKVAVYTLSAPQPLESLSIKLNDRNALLPVDIHYKKHKSDKEWIKLSSTILRNLANSDNSNTEILLNALIVEQIQITAINSRFNSMPTVTPFRKSVTVIFNSANNGPFILAWGSAQAKSAAIAPEVLLNDDEEIQNIPLAWIGDNVKLAGEQALQTKSTESGQFPRWIIWIALIAGVAFLVLLALKLIKEIKK